MTSRPTVVNPATSVRDAAQNMTRSHFRQLPVCSDSGLVGIIDITDICRALIDPAVSRRPAGGPALGPDGLAPAANQPPPPDTSGRTTDAGR
jgi:CBS domain-containing protein